MNSELAEVYGIETKFLVRAVKRNPKRFPADFMFQLSAGEFESLSYQIGTLETGRGQHDESIRSLIQAIRQLMVPVEGRTK